MILGADPTVDAVHAFEELYPQCKYVKGRYLSPWSKDTEKSFSAVIKWLATRKQNKLRFPKSDTITTEELFKPCKVDLAKINSTETSHLTWIGHATCYYQTEGLHFITDPVFSERASLTQFLGPKRYVSAPISVKDLKIDVVLLSHTHYDHLDMNSAREIGNRALWMVPLGVKALLASEGITNCLEFNWWDSHIIKSPLTNKEVNITFTPAKHWTARGLLDRNTCLWGSFAVISSTCRFYFGGDTAYCNIFKQIGERFGPFDFSALPIGAYKPRDFMKDVHCNPAEAVQIHKDLQSKQSMAIHWGTFPLADEDFVEPALELARARDVAKVSKDSFFTIAHGDTQLMGEPARSDLASRRSDLMTIYNAYVGKQIEGDLEGQPGMLDKEREAWSTRQV